LLLIDGHDDILLTESASEKVLQRICAAGGHAPRKVYPGLGHDAVVYESMKDQMDWIAARYSGEPTPNNCAPPSTTVVENVSWWM